MGSGVAVDREFPPTGRIPDVFVLRREAFDAKTLTFEPTDILVAVEAVSPNTTKTDRVEKRADYERAGIEHYWILDVRTRTRGPKLTVLELVGGVCQEQPAGPDADGLVTIREPVELSFR